MASLSPWNLVTEPRVGWLFPSLPSGSFPDRAREVWLLAPPGLPSSGLLRKLGGW